MKIVRVNKAGFFAEVHDMDCRRPLTSQEKMEIEDAIARYGVLVFKNQSLRNDEHIAFAIHFGEVEAEPVNTGRTRLTETKLNDISNLNADGSLMKADDRRRMFSLGNRLWHSDSSFKTVPASYSFLFAHVVPPHGGETEFADMRAAWDALPVDQRTRLTKLDAWHSLLYSRELLGFSDFNADERAKYAPVRHPMSRVHPISGRRSLFISSHIGRVEGMLVPEGKELIRDLMESATQREFVHSHSWSVGDLVMWDNRCTMHRGRPFDDQRHPRDLRRVTLVDASYGKTPQPTSIFASTA